MQSKLSCWFRYGAQALIALGILGFFFLIPAQTKVFAQQPTGSVPTVTGTPSGPIVRVYQDLGQITVYSGPSSFDYPAIGLLLSDQQVPALGSSPDGTWIQIYYPGVPGSRGWIYAPYVSISSGSNLPVLPVPPTPTALSTPTIDPTLSAAFITPDAPRRLATYTPPAPLVVPTFVDETPAPSAIPIGLLIFGFGFVGGLGAFISFLRGR
ncbi:MAG TPA: SH3 domain-containing protein [Anaerolineales bacterium]|nr:SH3 domain-containing protein [Anaerolineales bacterium]